VLKRLNATRATSQLKEKIEFTHVGQTLSKIMPDGEDLKKAKEELE
jgi:hypothetical protein